MLASRMTDRLVCCSPAATEQRRGFSELVAGASSLDSTPQQLYSSSVATDGDNASQGHEHNG